MREQVGGELVCQHLISADTGHTDSSVITISVAPAALHADEPDNHRFSTVET